METEERELYNLNEDPKELINVVDQEDDRVRDCEQKLFLWLEKMDQDHESYLDLIR